MRREDPDTEDPTPGGIVLGFRVGVRRQRSSAYSARGRKRQLLKGFSRSNSHNAGRVLAITMSDAGNHLRIGPPWWFGPVEQMLDDLLKDGRVQLVPHVLSVALGQHEVGVAEDAEVS